MLSVRLQRRSRYASPHDARRRLHGHHQTRKRRMEVRVSPPGVRRSKAVNDVRSAHGGAKAGSVSAPEYTTVSELLALYRKRAASPVEVVKDLLDRVSQYE